MASPSNAAMTLIDEDATYVQVKSIDGTTITAVIGTMTQPSGQQDENGQKAGDSASAPQGTPQQPSGDGTSQPDGQKAPGGQGGGMMGFTAGEAVITFSVDDATSITRQNGPETAEAALGDIAVGDILAVSISSSNIAQTILIQANGAAPASSTPAG